MGVINHVRLGLVGAEERSSVRSPMAAGLRSSHWSFRASDPAFRELLVEQSLSVSVLSLEAETSDHGVLATR
jgi:hypothetical protein